MNIAISPAGGGEGVDLDNTKYHFTIESRTNLYSDIATNLFCYSTPYPRQRGTMHNSS